MLYASDSDYAHVTRCVADQLYENQPRPRRHEDDDDVEFIKEQKGLPADVNSPEFAATCLTLSTCASRVLDEFMHKYDTLSADEKASHLKAAIDCVERVYKWLCLPACIISCDLNYQHIAQNKDVCASIQRNYEAIVPVHRRLLDIRNKAPGSEFASSYTLKDFLTLDKEFKWQLQHVSADGSCWVRCNPHRRMPMCLS